MASPARTTAHIAPVEDSEESVVETSVVEAAQESSSETAARPEELRLLEALLFASTEPLEESALAKRMPEGVDVKKALAQLQAEPRDGDDQVRRRLKAVVPEFTSPPTR